jgi:predicted metalloprotease with PDZ domain
MIKRVVVEEKAVYGELPRYDVGSYTFIADYLPYVYGDGMEHRNSTIVVSSTSLAKNAVGMLGTIAHEYFHSWNVERMRPKSLEPFNFEEANMSGELWFAEGFTNYYGNLFMMRAGMISLDRFAKNLSGGINYVVNGPGRKYFSLVEMSEQAPFVDAATSIDQQNRSNTFISYYSYGEVVALGLDLTLRTRFPGRTLDGFMRSVWKMHGKTEVPYTNEDLRAELGAFTGSPKFADSVFHEYVYGHALPDYESLLSRAAFKLRKSKEKKASIGNEALKYEEGKATVNSPTTVNGPLYRAGLDRTDKIVSIDRMKLASAGDLDTLLAKHKPGESVEIEYEQRGSAHSAKLTFDESNQMEVVPYETALIPVTDSMKSFRSDWLGSKAEEKFPELTKTCRICKRAYPFSFEFCHFDGDTLRVFPEK